MRLELNNYAPTGCFVLACQTVCGELLSGPGPAPAAMNEDSLRHDDDRRLLAAVARGDTGAFADLYDRLSGPLYGLCQRMAGGESEAEDILQEAFLTIWRRAATYDDTRGSVFTWAVHLTRCKIIDHLRARGRRLRVLALPNDSEEDRDAAERAPAASNDPAAGDAVDQRAQAGRVRQGLQALPREQGQAIELAFFSDLTHHEISARLGQPLGTIKARIRRGMLRLRGLLKGEEPGREQE